MAHSPEPLRIVFAGTPTAAVPSLLRLADGVDPVVAVITREDAPLGRKRIVTPSAVAVAAEEAGLELLKSNRLDSTVTDRVAQLNVDLGVIVAYGGLVREPLLSLPRLGWINLHFSLLPKWRGAAPVQRAIMAGDQETGAAVFQLVPELDAGDVFARLTRSIGSEETAGEVLDALSVSGANLLLEVVQDLRNGDARAQPQLGAATFAPKLTLDDAHIDFGDSAERIDHRIRAVTPEPGAFVTIAGSRIKIVDARIAENSSPSAPRSIAWEGKRLLVGTATVPIELVAVQPSGKRIMAAGDWWRGLVNRGGLTAE